MKKNLKRGFTLIELLVVIAIIGILAAVVIASLNSARSKGSDAAKKANLSNARSQAELFYDTNNTYSGVCATTAGAIGSMVVAAGGSATTTCYASASAYIATAPLSTGHWCIDSLGASRQVSAAATAVGACPAS